MFPLVDMSTRFCSPNQWLHYYSGSTIWLSWKFPQTSAPLFRMIPMSPPLITLSVHQAASTGGAQALTHAWKFPPEHFNLSRVRRTHPCPKGFKAQSEERKHGRNSSWEMTMRVVISKKRINFMVRVTDSKLWEENYLLRKTKCLWWFGSRNIRLLLMSAKK